MSYVLRIKDSKKTPYAVDGLKRYFSRHNIDCEIYFSENLVVVGIKNLRELFSGTLSSISKKHASISISKEHASILEKIGFDCKVLESGDYEELTKFLQKHNIKK